SDFSAATFEPPRPPEPPFPTPPAPPPPDPDLVALQSLSAATLRKSLLATSRIKDDTKDTAVLGYLREARLAAAMVYRYTLSPPARHPGPTKKELKEQHEEAGLRWAIPVSNGWIEAAESQSRERRAQASQPQSQTQALSPNPEPQAPPPHPEAPAPHAEHGLEARADIPPVLTPSLRHPVTPSLPQKPPPPARNSHDKPK